jgi:hypothetical protein
MDIGCIVSAIYLVVGVLLALKWFNDEYKDEYDELKKNGEVQSAMACILLMVMAIFWPIKLTYNLIKYGEI